MQAVAAIPEVTAASPTIIGSGFAARADATLPIFIRGVDPERFQAVIDLRPRMIEGKLDIAGDSVAIGATLADDLGVHVGDKLRVTSSEQRSDVVTVSGIFALGNAAVDKTWLLTSLRHAQALFALPGGATTIELKVLDVFDAQRVATLIHEGTGLDADSWMKLNAELLSGLSAQSSSKSMIQFFVVLAVALGIASVLIVSVVQKSREIGILRAVGTQPRRAGAVLDPGWGAWVFRVTVRWRVGRAVCDPVREPGARPGWTAALSGEPEREPFPQRHCHGHGRGPVGS
jgi:lipoprotein-releasing system permease protein